MKVSEGYSMADSRNLPKVDYLMLLEYMRENECFNVAEIRGTKVLMSSREAYVEKSVGYVEIKRENSVCLVQGRVTPEHRVRTKMYTVAAVIEEVEEKIIDVKCHDCAASEGGCKHTICFLMWLIKRTDEPSVTSQTCYWAQPKLSVAVTQDRFVLAKEMVKRKYQLTLSLPPTITRSSFVEECKKRKMGDSMIVNYNCVKETLDKYSIYNILLQCKIQSSSNNINLANLKLFAEKMLTPEIIKTLEECTRGQADNMLWHTLRQCRITASKIHEATKCHTDGTLVKTIFGGYKVPETKAIRRGKHLEAKVLKKVQSDLNTKIEPCGLTLVTPFVGVSPDGVCEDFCIEIKCPLTDKTMQNYVKDNTVTEKYKAQVQMQMLATGKKKALFCLADPKFEVNNVYHKYWLYFDKLYVTKLLQDGEIFWEKLIFPKLTATANVPS